MSDPRNWSNDYYDSVAEVRFFQRHPHLPTIDGSIAIPDVAYEDERNQETDDESRPEGN